MSKTNCTPFAVAPPRRTRPALLPYPELPEPRDKTLPRYAFSLACYQRALAEVQALGVFEKRREFIRHPLALINAVYHAGAQLQGEADKWLKYTIAEGGLLLAWIPDQEGARA